MAGWLIPPPRPPTKTAVQFRREREAKVAELVRCGLLCSARIEHALLTVPREAFIPPAYRDYAYEEVPLPLPGVRATISCPHSYPLFYEPLGLDAGHRFLEVGLGSGYGTALAREIVGPKGRVIAVELDPQTLAFARANLERRGYTDVVLIEGDGGLGCPAHAPFDRICVTAACEHVPPPLIEQLAVHGRLIAPLLHDGRQDLVVVENDPEGLRSMTICEVLYVPLRGRFGGEEGSGRGLSDA